MKRTDWVMATCVVLSMTLTASAQESGLARLPAVEQSWLFRGQASATISSMDQPDVYHTAGLGTGLAAGCDACASCDSAGSACGSCTSCGPCCDSVGSWADNTLVFLAGDGWKNIFDDDDNNNFGFRTGFNTGFGMGGSPVRAQLGASYGAYDFHGREDGQENVIEQQVFVTGGFYKRSDVCCGDNLSWGVVYDWMLSEDAGEMTDRLRLGQIRGQVGWAWDEANEFGIWAAFRANDDFATTQNVSVNVQDQVNFFWHRNWAYGGDTFGYIGFADDPGETVLGLSGNVPLSSRVAVMGNVHYVVPSTTGGDVHPTLGTDDIFNQETWNVSFGLVFYRGGNASSRTVSGNAGLPLLPVADNSTFNFQAPVF